MTRAVAIACDIEKLNLPFVISPFENGQDISIRTENISLLIHVPDTKEVEGVTYSVDDITWSLEFSEQGNINKLLEILK